MDMNKMLEFSNILELRNYNERKCKGIQSRKCLPEQLTAGKTYKFLEEGQTIYPLDKLISLAEKNGSNDISKVIAHIYIKTYTSFILNNREVHTKGKYLIKKVLIN